MANVYAIGERFQSRGVSDLSSLLIQECTNLKIAFEEKRKLPDVTAVQKEQIDKLVFPKELNFNVPVEIAKSKQAFQVLVAGLDDDFKYENLWMFREHDPRAFTTPLEALNISSGDVTVVASSN